MSDAGRTVAARGALENATTAQRTFSVLSKLLQGPTLVSSEVATGRSLCSFSSQSENASLLIRSSKRGQGSSPLIWDFALHGGTYIPGNDDAPVKEPRVLDWQRKLWNAARAADAGWLAMKPKRFDGERFEHFRCFVAAPLGIQRGPMCISPNGPMVVDLFVDEGGRARRLEGAVTMSVTGILPGAPGALLCSVVDSYESLGQPLDTTFLNGIAMDLEWVF